LLSEHWSPAIADSMVDSVACELERRLVQMEFPSDCDISMALATSSREVKFVFGILGFPAKAFVLLVNKYGLATIDDVYWNRDIIGSMAEDGISEGCLWKLECFICWYIEFLSNHEVEPQLIDIDFNENIWWCYYCYGLEDDARLEHPMFRGCTEVHSSMEINFCMYAEYANYCELDLVKLAVS